MIPIQKKNLESKQEVLRRLLGKVINRKEASASLTCTERPVNNYLARVLQGGLAALRDQRTGNNRKATPKQRLQILEAKRRGPWRSARKALEITGVTCIGLRQVQRLWSQAGLNRPNLEAMGKTILKFRLRV